MRDDRCIKGQRSDNFSFNADVLLLAAGFGNRLRPLTETLPKPLIEVRGRSLLEWNLLALHRSGCRRVFVNAHYLAPQIVSFAKAFNKVEIEIEVIEEPVILDTGGAIRNIESKLQHDNVIIVNSDILLGEDFDFRQVLKEHEVNVTNGAVATLVLRKDVDAHKFGILETTDDGRIVSLLGESFRDVGDASCIAVEQYMFLGVSAWNRLAFTYMPPAGNIFSLTRDALASILRAGEQVSSFVYNGYWSDIGTIERLDEARK